jgi:hypothetical protein
MTLIKLMFVGWSLMAAAAIAIIVGFGYLHL